MNYEHHEKAIAALAARARRRGARALIVVGSVARGTARAHSDVDAYEVVDDDRFTRALERGHISWVETEDCAWPGGYCDIKLVSSAVLSAAAERGDDPVRASFVGARIVFDDAGNLAGLIGSVTRNDAARFTELVTSFSAQLALHGEYFLPQALQLGNVMLARASAVHAAQAAGRIVLAHHRVHFRGPKYLTEQLAALPADTSRLVATLEQLCEQPSSAAMTAVQSALSEWWPASESIDDDVLSRFIIDNEMSWFTGVPPAEAR